MALHVRGEGLELHERRQVGGAHAREPPAVVHHRHLAPAEQGRGRPQRVRARGGHPPARHAGQPAHVRDHDARQRRRRRKPAGAGQALGPARDPVAPAGAGLPPQARTKLDQLTAEVKDLADRKKFVYDDDLLALAGHAPTGSLRLVRYQAVTGNRVMPTATVEVERDGRPFAASAVGNGPLDAALKAADAALGLELELLELHTRAVTAGKDALAEVSVRVRFDGREAQGQAASTDSIEAALKAYLSAAGAARAGRGGGVSQGPRTLFQKVWDAHVVRPEAEDTPAVLYVDLHLAARGDFAAGLRRPAGARPARATTGPDARDHGPRDPDDAAPERIVRAFRSGSGGAGGAAGVEHARGGDHALRPGPRAAGHRARDRARAGRSPSRADHRLRRQPHQHARRLGRARVRHRHQRGGPGAGHAVPAAGAAAHAGGRGRGAAGPGRHREGPEPRAHRAARRRTAAPATSSSTGARRCARSRSRSA